MSNLVPALVFVPVFATGLYLFQIERHAASVICFAASIVIGLFAVNLLGLFQNRKMRAELKHLVHSRSEPNWFVGIGKPGTFGALDPHEDIGFLILTSTGIEYVGESAQYKIPYADVLEVGYRMNAHSLLGLGRWVALNGRHDGRPFRFLFEPRSRPTILQNKNEGKLIVEQIRRFLN
jgi:hypothetical protein